MADDRLISGIVTFHKERELAVPTLHSIERMRCFLESHGWQMELVMTLDGDDAATEQAVLDHPAVRPSDVLHRIHVSDLSLSRNYAIERARGTYVATLDGDDLFSENWIHGAVQLIEATGPKTIVHPALLIAFGAWTAYWYQIDQTDERFLPESLMSLNHWNACSVARREVFVQCPYQYARVGESGFGFEDWHWNCETIAQGYTHRVAPNTFRLERRKAEGSLNVAHQSHAAILRPTAFFDSL
ncbi:glycosyltransferase [Oleiagrimonas sp. C23AA]|uniref:glycosyltransferase n=1 Tax=Oleiagrimonas sp. C23AA TaxID=2719047 RepID=UPI00141F6B04|nr:glycosyltransferase [Oleiagrimonas sp. C23AA]NII12385.1 glycosyltransferase family 2 protein [Oleiagrimonas sp. C23AA]